MATQRRRAKQGSGALHHGFRSGRQSQPPQAAGEDLPRRSPVEREDASTEAIRPPPQRPERRERRRSSSRRSGRRHREPKKHAVACLSPTPPRPAERVSATNEPRRRKPPPRHHGRPGGKSVGAAPRALRDDGEHGLLGDAGQLRRSLLPPEKQGDGGPTLDLGSGRADPRYNAGTTARSHYRRKATTTTSADTSPPPLRPASPAGSTAVWAGSLELTLLVTANAGCRYSN
jgi:hypothetical protein